MKEKAQDLISIILYISFIVVLGFVTIGNIQNPWVIISLSALFIASFTIRNTFIYQSSKHDSYGMVSIILDLCLVFIINILDKGNNSFIYYLIIISDTTINYSKNHGLISLFASFLLFIINLSIRFNCNLQLIIPRSIIDSLAFGGVFAVMSVAKYFIRQNEFIQKTLKDLTIKTLEQQRTYDELKTAYEKLEEMTVLKERNKIAREIHDTVGHTLTTVLVEMEAGKMVLDAVRSISGSV